MSSKILKFAEKTNEPLVRFIIIRGWYLRLLNKKFKNAKFRELSKVEKKEIKQYWKNYGKKVSTAWCSYYSYGSEMFDEKIIPDSLYYGEILRKLNDFSMSALRHKNLTSLIFSSVQPKTVLRKEGNILLNDSFEPISNDEGLRICEEHESIIIKPSIGTYGGSGISFWNKELGIEQLREIIDSYDKLIIQKVLKQNNFFASIHASSLNTLRIVTLLVDGRPVLLSTILRMGQNKNRVDNYSAGGVICPVDKDGYLFDKAVQSDQSVIDKHPDGFVFKGKKIPLFETIIDEVFRQHYRIPYFKLVSWDFTLSPEGIPVLIEANIPSGQLDLHQLNIGSLFGQYTDRVLDYVYKDIEL